MISSDLKTQDLTPRASLPFSWNSDGDSRIATGGPTGATAFQKHLKSAQSAQSAETGSSPVADAPQKAERAGSADPSSRVSSQNPSSHPQVRPSIKPIRKASLNLRAMVDAKVRFNGPSTASTSTPSGSSSVPSAQAGPSSWGEPFGPTERLEPDTRRPPAQNSGVSTRNDVLQGVPERPLMDSRRLPDAEVVLLLDRRADSQDVPSSQQLSGDVFSAPSDAGLTYASRMVLRRSDWETSPDSNSQGQPEFASAHEELPASRSATASESSMGSDPISSGIREAARRAVAQSQILGTSPVAVASVRPANNSEAFRRLILDAGTGTLPSLTTDSAPPFGERLIHSTSNSNPGSPSVPSLSSFLPVASTPSPKPEPDSGEPSASSQLEIVTNRVSDPAGVQRNVATATAASFIIPVESGSQNGEVIQRETRSANPNPGLSENPSTIEATDSSAASQSSLAESQSPPKPSGPSLRPANRSPHARGIDPVASTVSARTSVEADKSSPTPLALENGTEDRMRLDSLGRDAGSGGIDPVASTVSARTSVEADKSSPTPLALENGTEDRMRLDSLGRDAGSGSSSHPGPGHSQAAGTPAASLFPGGWQAPSLHEPLVDGASNSPKTSDAGSSASLLHESHKSGAVRLVHLDSPGAGGLELRIQELGDKLIIQTQDLVGSIDGQSTQWKELQQRLETSGIVLMPIEASLGATATPIEARSSSEELRHTVCYDGSMGSTGRDSSDPRSSSGRARSSGEPSHLASPEVPDETTESAEVTPASRQWWA